MRPIRARKSGADNDVADDAPDGDRRRLLTALGSAGAAGLAVGGGAGGALLGLLAGPARADPALDIQILQTASSLERLAVDTYQAFLTQGTAANQALAAVAIPTARSLLTAFATTTRAQHAGHLKAFQSRTTDLGGTVQDGPNPTFAPAVAARLAGASDVGSVLDLAATLEAVATDTYLQNLTMLTDRQTKVLVAGVLGIAAQRLATLRVLGALLATPQLIAAALPQTDLAKVPRAILMAAVPDARRPLAGPAGVAEPASGALR